VELTNFKTLKATKKVKILIYELEERLLKMQDALDNMARAAEIAQITNSTDMLSSFVAEAQDILADRLERPDTSIGADEQKIKILTDKKDAEERGS